MKVPYINLGLQHKDIKGEILESISQLLDSGQFILGEELSRFEASFAKIAGTKYALGVANGTDSLFLTMRALGIGQGDEVITAPNSFLASASSVALIGATPVFADVRDNFNLDPEKVERAITSKTKAIIVVHLTGRPADMDELMAVAYKHNIPVIEDAAQAVGATYKDQPVGSFGIAGSFSLHPLKNLSACGDGGVITTNDEALYKKLIVARNHGLKNRDECEFWSYNSRLDTLQAAVLNVKLKKLDQWNERRRAIASKYNDAFSALDMILPVDAAGMRSVYHTYIIQYRHRDELKAYLAEKGIDTKIHYPLPIHYQEAASELGYKKGNFPVTERQSETILSLPVYPELTDDQVAYIADCVIEFCSIREKKKTSV